MVIRIKLNHKIRGDSKMNMLKVIDWLSSKDGDELFDKVKTVLEYVGIAVYNEDGSVKDLYTVICEVAEVLNKEK